MIHISELLTYEYITPSHHLFYSFAVMGRSSCAFAIVFTATALFLSALPGQVIGGFWSTGGGDAEAAASAEVEVGANGGVAPKARGGKNKRDPKCEPVLRQLPGKFLGPLGDQRASKSTGSSSLIVFIAQPGSSWWCGSENSLTAVAKKSRALQGTYTAGVFLASAKSKGVRAAFGITEKSQVPAVATIELSSGRRYVLRSGEVPSELPDEKAGGLSAASTEQITSIFSKPKPLDIFDVAWYASRTSGERALSQEEDVPLIMVMVKSVSDAKSIVKSGLRKVAHAHRGEARVVLCKDRDTWTKFGVDESSLPTIVSYNFARDKISRHSRVNDVPQTVAGLIDGIVSKKTHTTVAELNDPERNFTGGFHRVSWSPHLYVMDGFLSPAECESMIKNAYPTLSTGSLVGDNINKKIKDLRFTVVPADRFTHVEHDVVHRIHDHIRISEPHGEILQVSEYLPGQKYTLHPDSIGSSPGPHSMQRIVTVLMYLNDVEEGGYTVFPRGNGLNRHITRHDTEPWNLEYICGQENVLKIAPKAGRAIFWYNHHTDLSWDQNTLHGACHVKKGIKYVAQRWVRWHTSETDGDNPLQNALDKTWHLSRQLDEARRVAQASGAGQTKELMNKVQNYENELQKLRKHLHKREMDVQDLEQRVADLGDVVPITVQPSSKAAAWRTWIAEGSLFVPVVGSFDSNKDIDVVCLLLGELGCSSHVKSIYADASSPIFVSDLINEWRDGFDRVFRWSISRSPYARLVSFYERIAVRGDTKSDIDRTWKQRLDELGSFHEFIVGPVRMYHFGMTPTAGGDIGRHPGTRPHLFQFGGNGLSKINYVARYEHLMRDLNDLCQKHGNLFSPGCESRLANKLGNSETQGNGIHSKLIKYFDSERVNLWEIVNEAFAQDFNALGYPRVKSEAEYREKYMPLSLGPLINARTNKALP